MTAAGRGAPPHQAWRATWRVEHGRWLQSRATGGSTPRSRCSPIPTGSSAPPSAFDLIPPGGGDPRTGHRCAGEWITIELVKQALRLLARGMRYEVPDQDLRLRRSRMPSIPRSGFVIAQVRALPGIAAIRPPASTRGLEASQAP